MAKSNFENLRVYQLSEDLADRIWEVVIGWDKFARDTVGGQIVRAVDSIGANIAEVKPLVDNLAPMLNAYLKSIGRVSAKAND